MDSKINFEKLPLPGAFTIHPDQFEDDRGAFSRLFCAVEFEATGLKKPIVQINHSATARKGTVRGLHYQVFPACESKIIRCIKGRIFDVMVDLRVDSPNFMHWHAFELSENNRQMVLIPEGVAHGFQSLTDDVELIYLHTQLYSPQHERGLKFDDPSLDIQWPLPLACISPRDEKFPLLHDFKGIAP